MLGTGMGGSSDHWGATSPRFMPEAFEIATHLKQLHGASKLPPDNLIQDYGVTWKEMEPYYTRAEEMMGTSGKAGNLNGRKVEGGSLRRPAFTRFSQSPASLP